MRVKKQNTDNAGFYNLSQLKILKVVFYPLYARTK